MKQCQQFVDRGESFPISSKKTIPGISLMFAFDKKSREVIVLIPHWRIAAFIASCPDVKFRLTGFFPAKNTAILASAPPAEAGSRIPTIESFGRYAPSGKAACCRSKFCQRTTRCPWCPPCRTKPKALRRPDKSGVEQAVCSAAIVKRSAFNSKTA